jgi:hypothetical protein
MKGVSPFIPHPLSLLLNRLDYNARMKLKKLNSVRCSDVVAWKSGIGQFC